MKKAFQYKANGWVTLLLLVTCHWSLITLAAGQNVRTIPELGSQVGVTVVKSSAYEASRVIKATPGTLISLVGYNSKASAQFIQVYNTTSVPADTAVPVYTFTVPATSNFSLDVPITGIPFTTGICVANSSTGATKTVGSADCWFTAVIK
jgi:hypothetical protein